MALTPQQLPALKAAIAAATDPDFVFARENGQTGVMAALFNGAGTFVVRRAQRSGQRGAARGVRRRRDRDQFPGANAGGAGLTQ